MPSTAAHYRINILNIINIWTCTIIAIVIINTWNFNNCNTLLLLYNIKFCSNRLYITLLQLPFNDTIHNHIVPLYIMLESIYINKSIKAIHVDRNKVVTQITCQYKTQWSHNKHFLGELITLHT